MSTQISKKQAKELSTDYFKTLELVNSFCATANFSAAFVHNNKQYAGNFINSFEYKLIRDRILECRVAQIAYFKNINNL